MQLIDAKPATTFGPSVSTSPWPTSLTCRRVVARLANQLGTELVTAEARRAERAPHPNSMDLYFQGMAVANRGFTPENLLQARSLFEGALSLDPGNIEALVGTAFVDTMRGAAI